MAKRTLLDRNGSMMSEVITDDHQPHIGIIHNVQDVEPLLGHIKARREQSMSDNLRPVAEIPLVIWNQLVAAGIADDNAAIKKWLNDPDNRAFRLHQGRV